MTSIQIYIFLLLIILCLLSKTLSYFIEGTYNLSAADLSKGKIRVGLFTPYELTPGGGEKYFLSVATTFFNMGCSIELMLKVENVCGTRECLLRTLNKLRVPLNPMDFTIRYFTPEQFMAVYFAPAKIEYDIFFTIGNSKYPMMYSMGLFNMYMCQFPFDLYKPPKDFIRSRLAYYDLILVNSRFSFDWYLRSIQRDAVRFLTINSYVPALVILHPPVDPFKPVGTFESLQSLPDKARVTNIAVVGRFFKGRQSKGHDSALQIIQEVVSRTNLSVHLYLCGYVHPDETSHKYIDQLKETIKTNNLPATIVVNADGKEIEKILEKSMIFWHLTGVNYLSHPKDDPASFEHFGIAIIEGMFMGLIPMVTSVGGPVDIVKDGYNGFLCSTIDAYVNNTLKVLGMTKAESDKIRSRAFYTAEKFKIDHFIDKLQSMIIHGVTALPLTNIAQRNISGTRLLKSTTSARSNYIAVIIEYGLNPLVEISIRNAAHYLGPMFSIQLHHSELNLAFYRTLLKDMNIQFVLLSQPIYLAEDYNKYLKSKKFWALFQPESKVLLFSAETVFLRSPDKSFFNYDFISAPIDVNYLKNAIKERGGELPLPDKLSYHAYPLKNYVYSTRLYTDDVVAKAGLGIGSGFSMRSVHAMQTIIDSHSGSADDSEPESVFFLRHFKAMNYTVTPRIVSYKFGWEVDCPDLEPLKGIPFAIHSAWLFMNRKMINGLIQTNFLDTDYRILNLPNTFEGILSSL